MMASSGVAPVIGQSKAVLREASVESVVGSPETFVIDKKRRARRDHQQTLLYLFISLVIILAWFLGVYQMSFLWTFCLLVLVLVVWKGRQMSLLENYLREKELELHRRRALRQSETTEWLNFCFNRWWVFSEASIVEVIKRKLNPALDKLKPSYLHSLELNSFTFGSKTPYIKYMNVYESSEMNAGVGGGGGRKAMTWANIMTPPVGLLQATKFQVVLETQVGLQSDDFLMIFRATLGGKWLGMNLDLAIERLNLNGRLQVVLKMDLDHPFPHITTASFSFMQQPEVWFDVRVLKAVQVMEVPVLKMWLHQLVLNALCEAIVDPGLIDINMENTGPAKIPTHTEQKSLAVGVLTITMDCKYVKVEEKDKKEKKSVASSAHPLEYIDDVRYCKLRIGTQSHTTASMHNIQPWTETCSFLMHKNRAEKLLLDVKSKMMLTRRTVVQFELPLDNLQLEQQHSGLCSVTRVLEKQLAGTMGGHDRLIMTLNLNYTPLTNIETSIKQGTLLPTVGNSDVLCGILYVCIHGATDLMGMDSNGLSDPYCFLYICGKKLTSTHYVTRTRAPRWDVDTEVIVDDVTKTVLSFIVYDWDGHSVSEDDFLGSAHLLLSKDESSFVRRQLSLSYNLFHSSSSASPTEEPNNLGSICVTVIFRPVPAISANRMDETFLAPPPSTPLLDRGEGGAGGGAGGEGRGGRRGPLADIIEINLIQAKDLMAMDRNGFSDPYVEIMVDGKRKCVSDVKKKTLTPVWNSKFTLPLITPSQTLDIQVWDRDAFFQKDFLGSLSYTLPELKQISSNKQHDGWFTLQRIQTGSIQIKFNVVSDELNHHTSHPPSRSDARSEAETAVVQPSVKINNKTPASEKSVINKSMDESLVSNQSSSMTSFGDKNGSPIRRAASDVKLNGLTNQRGAGGVSKDVSRNTLLDKSTAGLLSPDSCYFGLTGQILAIKGLADPDLHIYIKVRLASELASGSHSKKSAALGTVIAKSPTPFLPSMMTTLDFQVDHGRGVSKEAKIVFDVKSGHYSHLATHSFSLHKLLGDDHKETTQWLSLSVESGIEIKVKLTYTGVRVVLVGESGRGGGREDGLATPQRSRSFLGGLRPRSFHKKADEKQGQGEK